MSPSPGIAIMKNIWKSQVEVVNSDSIPRYQDTKFQILDILPLWKPFRNENFKVWFQALWHFLPILGDNYDFLWSTGSNMWPEMCDHDHEPSSQSYLNILLKQVTSCPKFSVLKVKQFHSFLNCQIWFFRSAFRCRLA